MGANLSIVKKGLLLVAIPLLAQLLFLGILIKMRSDQAEAQRWAIHSQNVLSRTEHIYRSAIEAHSATLAFVLIGDEALLRAYGHAVKEQSTQIEELRNLVRNSPYQQEKVQEVAARSERMTAWLGEMNRLVRDGRRDKAVARIKALEGQQLAHNLRAALDDFLGEQERLNAERTAALERAGLVQNWVLAVGGLLALISTGLLLWLFGRGIVRRLGVLQENARRLAEGKEVTAPLAGTDEISQLDHVFHDMAKALAQKDRENEMFIYSVSHDLRSPLVNLQGFSQELAAVNRDLRGLIAENELPDVVRKRGLTLIDRDASESVHFIQTAVSRLASIIDSLLRLSRVGRVQYQWQAVDVRAVVVRVVEALRGTLTEKGAEVAVNDLPPCWGDPTAVEQVFANLIGNAVNYLDPQRPGRIEVGCAPTADASGLRTYFVKDNGLGIPEPHLSKVFLAFQRLHPEAAQGEGIGLAMVRRIVERHSGRVWLESEAGVGSTFFVALPVQPPNGAVPGRGLSQTMVSQPQEN
jgi:signal transduction histidine kinase